MDVMVIAPERERLDLLGLVIREACRVAGISPIATESETKEISRLRLKLARSILEGISCGERDPAKLRVTALRSTMHCCVSEGTRL
jgi:hypothetical protein